MQSHQVKPAPRLGTRTTLFTAGVLVLVAGACGGNASDELVSEADAAPVTVDETGTTLAEATTTTSTTSTTTTTIHPLLIDFDELGPIPPLEPTTAADALLGGAPDEVVSGILAAAMEDAGADLSGMTVTVWPVSGTGESLLILRLDDPVEGDGLFGEGDSEGNDGTAVMEALLSHPLIDEQGITRVVFRTVAEVPLSDGAEFSDETEEYVFTLTIYIEDLRLSLATGESVDLDQMLFQIELVEP